MKTALGAITHLSGDVMKFSILVDMLFCLRFNLLVEGLKEAA